MTITKVRNKNTENDLYKPKMTFYKVSNTAKIQEDKTLIIKHKK